MNTKIDKARVERLARIIMANDKVMTMLGGHAVSNSSLLLEKAPKKNSSENVIYLTRVRNKDQA